MGEAAEKEFKGRLANRVENHALRVLRRAGSPWPRAASLARQRCGRCSRRARQKVQAVRREGERFHVAGRHRKERFHVAVGVRRHHATHGARRQVPVGALPAHLVAHRQPALRAAPRHGAPHNHQPLRRKGEGLARRGREGEKRFHVALRVHLRSVEIDPLK